MDYVISNLPRVTLDPRNDQEVLEKAIAVTSSASQGLLTDFSSSSVAGNILKGQVFAHLELKWYLNKVVVAIAIEILRLFGIVRGLGTPSQGSITVVLKNSLMTPYVLPIGYQFPYRSTSDTAKELHFVTTEQLIINPGANAGTVKVVASRTGLDTNLPELGYYRNDIASQVAYVYNESALSGGTDIEPLEVTVARGQRALRQRQTLVTIPEYEDFCENYLGYGSKVTGFPATNLIFQDGIQGHIHLVCANPDGQPPSTDLLQVLRSEVTSRSFATASVWISPISIFEVSLDIVVDVRSFDDVSDSDLYEKLSAYFLDHTLGSSIKIKELEYVIRSIPGISSIQYVTINGDALNTPMPGKTYTPRIVQITLTKVDDNNNSLTTYPEAIIDPD